MIGLEVLTARARPIDGYMTKMAAEGFSVQSIGYCLADRQIEMVHGDRRVQIEHAPAFKKYRNLESYPNMKHCIGIRADEVSNWPRVVSTAEWLGETYRGVIYSSHTERPITNFRKRATFDPTVGWPTGRLAVLGVEKQAFIEKWNLETKAWLTYEEYLSTPDMFFMESGHLLPEQELFGIKLPSLKDYKGSIS